MPLHKRKGDKYESSYSRSIGLSSVPGKPYCRVMIKSVDAYSSMKKWKIQGRDCPETIEHKARVS